MAGKYLLRIFVMSLEKLVRAYVVSLKRDVKKTFFIFIFIFLQSSIIHKSKMITTGAVLIIFSINL